MQEKIMNKGIIFAWSMAMAASFIALPDLASRGYENLSNDDVMSYMNEFPNDKGLLAEAYERGLIGGTEERNNGAQEQ